jgi:hypothetical protein
MPLHTAERLGRAVALDDVRPLSSFSLLPAAPVFRVFRPRIVLSRVYLVRSAGNPCKQGRALFATRQNAAFCREMTGKIRARHKGSLANGTLPKLRGNFWDLDIDRSRSLGLEPITTAIISALSTGAALGGKEIATQALKDAYAGLKGWITSHYPGVSVEQLEKQPTSKARQEVVGEDLEREGASADTELVKLAKTVVDLIQKQAPEIARSIGVDLGELDQANVTFGKVLASSRDATGVKIDKVKGGTLSFQDVTAGSETDPSKKA